MGTKPQTEYPTISYLFKRLISPGGDPIAAKMAAVCLINPSTSLEAITGLLRDLNTLLEDISHTQTAQLLKPLHKKRIFPILGNASQRQGEFDWLSDGQDTSWLIADQRELKESFLGRIPLLAFRPEEIHALKHIISALGLECQFLSKRVRSRTHPRGRVALHAASTALLAARAPFIKA